MHARALEADEDGQVHQPPFGIGLATVRTGAVGFVHSEVPEIRELLLGLREGGGELQGGRSREWARDLPKSCSFARQSLVASLLAAIRYLLLLQPPTGGDPLHPEPEW